MSSAGGNKSSGGDAKGGHHTQEKRKKESILDMSKYLEKSVRIKFAGGRECSGVLKGYDPLLNIVLDNCTEYLRLGKNLYLHLFEVGHCFLPFISH